MVLFVLGTRIVFICAVHDIIHHSRLCITYFVTSVVVIGLEREAYEVTEDGGFIEVCAVVREGSLQRTVALQLSTNDLSAKSKYHNTMC